MAKKQSNEHPGKAMVVVAHPDDAEWGCSGTVAKWCRLGCEIVYVLCTDGSKGTEDRNISGLELARIRQREQKKAGEILGLKDIVFLDYPDGYLEPTLELRKDITREIRRHRPEILITTNAKRDLNNSNHLGHPDHYAAGEATASAVFPSARDYLTFPDLLKEGLEPHKVKELWIMTYGENTNNFSPIDRIDVEKSSQALLAHASQISDPERSSKWMRKKRQELGEIAGTEFAESFKVFKLR